MCPSAQCLQRVRHVAGCRAASRCRDLGSGFRELWGDDLGSSDWASSHSNARDSGGSDKDRGGRGNSCGSNENAYVYISTIGAVVGHGAVYPPPPPLGAGEFGEALPQEK